MGPCLYCLTEDGEPSVEHIVPAGLGQFPDLVLPRDAVCRDCNNFLGKQVDEALVHLPEIQLLRGLHQIPDSKGRVVDRLELGDDEKSWTFDENGSFHLDYGIRPDEELTGPDDEGILRIQLPMKRRGPASQRRRAARAVLKIGLGERCRRNPEAALHPRYDPARLAILGAGYYGVTYTTPLEDLGRPMGLQIRFRYDVPGMSEAVDFSYGAFRAITSTSLNAPTSETSEWASREGMTSFTINADDEPLIARPPLRRLLGHPRIANDFPFELTKTPAR